MTVAEFVGKHAREGSFGYVDNLGVRAFRQIFPELRIAAFLLAVTPFLLVSLIPNGYMPSVQADGTFTVTICTPEGHRTVALDADGNIVPALPDGQEGSNSTDHCLFAGVGTFFGTDQRFELHARLQGLHKDLVKPDLSLPPAAVPGLLGARAPPRRI
nr:hypothetical protein [uncultured Roseibium sp.]